jgi:hypothetical protein
MLTQLPHTTPIQPQTQPSRPLTSNRAMKSPPRHYFPSAAPPTAPRMAAGPIRVAREPCCGSGRGCGDTIHLRWQHRLPTPNMHRISCKPHWYVMRTDSEKVITRITTDGNPRVAVRGEEAVVVLWLREGARGGGDHRR